jgi:hypothetical protein
MDGHSIIKEVLRANLCKDTYITIELNMVETFILTITNKKKVSQSSSFNFLNPKKVNHLLKTYLGPKNSRLSSILFCQELTIKDKPMITIDLKS